MRLRGPLFPPALRTLWCFWTSSLDPRTGRAQHLIIVPADGRMLIAASVGELGSGDDDSVVLPPLGRVTLPESDPELTAKLSLAAESIGLHWRPPPSPEHLRLDD